MSNLDKTLAAMVGEKGLQTLKKTIAKSGQLDPLMPGMVLPRAILSWLGQNVKSMNLSEIKEVSFPGKDNILIYLTKSTKNTFAADIVENDKLTHSFENQTIPSSDGSVVWFDTVGDIFDSLDKKEKPFDLDSVAMSAAMIGMVAPTVKYQENPELSGVTGKLIDAFVANQLYKSNIAAAVDKVKDVELDPTKPPKKEILQKPYVSDAQRRFFHSAGAKKAGLTSADVKHWDEASKGKKLPEKVSKLEPTGGAASPHMPKQPKGAAPSIKASRDPKAAQNKQGQVKFKQKFGKLAQPPKNDYFQNKLPGVTKSEFHVAEEQLYQPCVHCGTAEFVKSENGPVYQPCACFMVTLRDGGKTTFVELKKHEGSYSLKFSPRADKDQVRAFLLTLRARLK